MKKIISLALCLTLIFSMVVIAASAAPNAEEVGKVAAGYAPAGTGIASLADATDLAGNYYLTADVTVAATIPGTFTGTIDGNGHTITVSAPLFAEFNGTIKNAILAGGVDYTAVESPVGVLAVQTSGTAVIENVKNTATVKGYLSNIANADGDIKVRTGAAGFIGFITGEPNVSFTNCANVADVNGYAAAGFIGYGNSKTAVVSFKNCLNSGKISTDGATKPSGGNNCAVGGLFGMTDYLASLTMEDCLNTGEISSPDTATNAPVGGLIGYVYGNRSFEGTVTLKNCKNTAKVTGANQVGGLAGQLNGINVIEDCENTGDVESTGNYAAGIVSRIGDDNKDKVVDLVRLTVKNTVNRGNVKSGNQYAAGFTSYNPWAAVAENCVNYGKIDSTASANSIHTAGIFGFVGYNNTMKYCFNYGEILGAAVDGKWSTGGIIGRSSNNGGKSVLMYCGNHGNVTGAASEANYGPSGVTGYLWGGSEMIGCYNVGTVTQTKAKGFVSGLCVYVNSTKTVFKNNFNTGKLVVPEGFSGQAFSLWYNKAAETPAENISGNYCLEGTVGFIEGATPAEGTLEGAVVKATAAQFASGEVAFKLNTAIGEKVFRQTIGTDAVPNLDPANKIVIVEKDGYANEAAPVVTTKPVETTKPTGTTKPADKPSSPSTGDSTVAVLVALLAASAGAVLVLKKKRD